MTEFGWPAGPDGYTDINQYTGEACDVASEANQDLVIASTLDSLDGEGLSAVVFEAFRENWKIVEGPIGPYWGICQDGQSDTCKRFRDKVFSSTISVNHDWSSAQYPPYLQPIVIAGPPTFHGPQPGVVRLASVSGTGFDLRYQEWAYLDGVHAQEDSPFVVLEQGRNSMLDQSTWEAGSFALGGTGNWQYQAFEQPFTGPISLFLTVQTSNGSQPVTVRARNVDSSGFEAALFEEQALMDGHVSETVGYLAIESTAGGGLLQLDGAKVPYLLQTLDTDERWAPALSQRLKVEEEQSLDAETDHIDETLHLLAIGNQVLAQQVTSNGGDTTALRRLAPTQDAPMEWGIVRGIDHDWQTLPFAKTYVAPVLVAKPASSHGGDPGVIRVQGLTATYAQLRYQEWNYLDGKHGAPEDVFYLVSETGEHDLGGLTVAANRLVSNKLGRAGQWEAIGLTAVFAADPAVFAAVMTHNGGDAVTTRIRNLGLTGFELSMDEQEAKSDGHINETLGWIAIAQGTGTTAEGRQLQVFFEQLDDTLTAVPYWVDTTYRYPTVVGEVDSTLEADPVFLRYANPGNAQIELKLAEEQSADSETDHLLEYVGVFVAE